MSAAASTPMLAVPVSRRLDGRYLVFRPAALSRPPGPAGARLSLVVHFLADNRAELVDMGLALEREPLVVREEFVAFLLAYRVRTGQRRIPARALRKFLDEWDHRWL
jgi:hypothetical protein